MHPKIGWIILSLFFGSVVRSLKFDQNVPLADELGNADQEALEMWRNDDGKQIVRHPNSSSFRETVFRVDEPNDDFLIIFYSHTCGHCQAVVPALKQFVATTVSPLKGIQIAVVNCARAVNAQICRQIKNYPTVFFFPKWSTGFNDGTKVPDFADLPLKMMRSSFENILRGKFDVSNSEEELVELDGNSYHASIQGGAMRRIKFLIAFFDGNVSKEWANLAKMVKNWMTFVRIAFVNCAKNGKLCKKEKVPENELPKAFLIDGEMKNEEFEYKNGKSANKWRDQLVQRLYSSVFMQNNAFVKLDVKSDRRKMRMRKGEKMRAKNGKIMRKILMRDYLPQLWKGIQTFTQIYIVVVFEECSTKWPNGTGDVANFASKLILSLERWRQLIYVIPIESAISPTKRVKVYRAGRDKPLLERNYFGDDDQMAFEHILSSTELMEDDVRIFDHYFLQTQCDQLFERCNSLYFASETDMLKSLREAFYDEVITKMEVIDGKHLDNLIEFVAIFAEHLPTESFIDKDKAHKALPNSSAAKNMFKEMWQFLKKVRRQSAKLLSDEWAERFKEIEKAHGSPFPVNEEWRHCKVKRGFLSHCKGAYLKNNRRFTCGLWTAFHVISVNAYKRCRKTGVEYALTILRAIRGWADSFFGCSDCRKHFLEMTDRAMPIEQKVKQPKDVVLYLWRAHNRVNERLQKEEEHIFEKKLQRDALFKKQIFPPKFLCTECQLGENLHEVFNFLLHYYRRIEPVGESFLSWERDLLIKCLEIELLEMLKNVKNSDI